MDQQTVFFKNRMTDLSRRAEAKHIVTFSNFLNLNEISMIQQMSRELYSSFRLSGGYGHAERQMAAFYPQDLCDSVEYPVDAVCIAPLSRKFAEKLNHRDILGAFMNLGLKREMLGDILVMEPEAVVLCVSSVSGYLTDQCARIRNTPVTCRQIPLSEFSYEPRFIEKESIVSSLRLDSVIADVCKLSRSAAQKTVSEGRAFVNAVNIQQNGYICRDGDVLSIRHFGKFRIETDGAMTRKGKIKYKYKIYS